MEDIGRSLGGKSTRLDWEFKCSGTEALGDPQCNLRISPLPPPVDLKSLHSMQRLLHDDQPFLSSRSSSFHMMKKPPSDHQLQADISSDPTVCLDFELSSEIRPPPGCINKNEPIALKNQKQDEQYWVRASASGWSDWIQASQRCIKLDEKQIFGLRIVDFVVELEVKYDCISNVSSFGVSKFEEFETMVKEVRIPLLHLKYGALPGVDSSDFLGEPSTGSIIVLQPKRGWWYFSIFNPTVTSTRKERTGLLSAEDEMCLTLSWRTRTCQQSLTGQDCQWPVLNLERFMKDEFESPLDSYYYPDSEADFLEDDSAWFSMENPQNKSTTGGTGTVERWTFAALKVRDGASGSTLSVDVQTATSVSAELYARHEGCPTDRVWDFQVAKDGSQRGGEPAGLKSFEHGSQMLNASRQQSLSLSVVYPMEGYWCLGLKYISEQKINIQSEVSDNSLIPNNLLDTTNNNDAKQFILAWLKRWWLYIYCIKRTLPVLISHCQVAKQAKYGRERFYEKPVPNLIGNVVGQASLHSPMSVSEALSRALHLIAQTFRKNLLATDWTEHFSDNH